MKMYLLTFSPTGGTKRVADILAEEWDGEKVEIDLTDPHPDAVSCTIEEEDLCLVAVPSYGGRVPAAAVQRLKKIQGNGADAVLICVYGNRAYEDTLLELEDTLIGQGFSCCAAVAAVAEHSIMRRFAAGRPDSQDEKELREFAGKIMEKRSKGEGRELLSLPGNRPYREFKGVPFTPQPGKKCNGCGLCSAQCPVEAIEAQAPFKADPDQCISCMRCAAVCPQHARSVNKAVLFAASQKMKNVCGGRKSNELFI